MNDGISHQKEFEKQLLIIKVIISSNDCISRIDFILSLFRSCITND